MFLVGLPSSQCSSSSNKREAAPRNPRQHWLHDPRSYGVGRVYSSIDQRWAHSQRPRHSSAGFRPSYNAAMTLRTSAATSTAALWHHSFHGRLA